MTSFPAGLDGVTFTSHGCKLLGGFYRAAGATPRPTVVLLHGVPGVEKNLDLAYGLRDAGFNCLYFHYRGCWGSEGDYAFTGLGDDVRAATEWVLAQPSVDKNRLALAGSSMGGYATLAGGAADLRFAAIAALCPLVDPVLQPMPRALAESSARMVHGASADELQRQWAGLPSIIGLTHHLRGRPLLLITGEQDSLFTPAQYETLAPQLPVTAWQRLAEGDHSFTLCRPRLVQTVVEWLSTTLL